MALVPSYNLSRISNIGFSELEIFKSKHRNYSRRILDFSMERDTYSYLNTICSDGDKFLFIGTEEGFVYTFSLVKNRFLAVFLADKWINSIQFSCNMIFCVGQERVIRTFAFRSFKKCFEVKANPDSEAYCTKGVKLCDTSINNRVIANVGFGRFTIIDSRKRKVIYNFDIAKDSMNEIEIQEREEEPKILNYCVIHNMFKLSYLIEDCDHIYFYNYKKHTLVYKIRLYDRRKMEDQNTIMVNSLLVEQDGYLFTILQFSTNQLEKSKLYSILYVIRITVDQGVKKIRLLFNAELSRPLLKDRKHGIRDL